MTDGYAKYLFCIGKWFHSEYCGKTYGNVIQYK